MINTYFSFHNLISTLKFQDLLKIWMFYVTGAKLYHDYNSGSFALIYVASMGMKPEMELKILKC